MIVTLEEMKLYLKIDSDDENTLITSLIITAEEICEGILRYPLSELTEIPNTIKQAIYFAVANMYESREKLNIQEVHNVLKFMLFSYRKDSW